MDESEVLVRILTLLMGLLVGGFLRPYLGQKGKNLATKEDIAEITNQIEGVRQQYTIEAEQLRADLRVIAHEREVRFVRLHERRADAIDELYKRIVRTQNAFYLLTGGIVSGEGDSFEERLKRAGVLANDLVDFFGEHRLYYDEVLIGDFGKFERALKSAWVFFSFRDREDWERTPRSERERIVEERRKAIETVRETIPELRLQIERRMRIALGETLAGSGEE